MKSGPQPTPRFKMLKLDILLAFGVLIVVIAAASLYAASHKSSPSNLSSSVPAGWNQFSSSKYSFKFNYPAGWGKPLLTVMPGKAGAHYQISFAADSKTPGYNKNLSVSISMDSADYSGGACAASCTPLTSQIIQNNLKTGSKSLLKHDDSSYAFLAAIGQNSTLTDVQTVSLSKINVTGAIGMYSVSTTTACPAGKFAPAAKGGCINSGDYDTLNSVMKSLKGA